MYPGCNQVPHTTNLIVRGAPFSTPDPPLSPFHFPFFICRLLPNNVLFMYLCRIRQLSRAGRLNEGGKEAGEGGRRGCLFPAVVASTPASLSSRPLLHLYKEKQPRPPLR